MDGPRGYYAKWNKSYDITYMWNPKKKKQTKTKQMNKQNKTKLTDTKKTLVVTRGEEGWRWAKSVKEESYMVTDSN